jgi:hypothetical protein
MRRIPVAVRSIPGQVRDLAAAFGAAWLAATASAQEIQGPTLREVRVETRDVFDDAEASANLIYWLANTFHATTDPAVVRRELFFAPGDPVSAEQVAELERNLRGLGLFGAVEARLREVGDGEADLDVTTRDRFSLLVSVSGAAIGGVTRVDGTIGESNLFGTGKRLSLSGRREDEDESYTLRYDDPQLFGSWYRLRSEVGDATEGAFGWFDLRRPFRHLADPWSYGIAAGTAGNTYDYFVAGEVEAEVPEDRQEASAFVSHAFGPRDLRMQVGLDMAGRISDYDPVTGSRPDLTEVPGDTRELQLGLSFGLDWNHSFRVAQRIDAIDYDEDIRLGASTNLRLALALRDEDGVGAEVQPLVALVGRVAAEVLPESFATFEVDAGLRWSGGEPVSGSARSALHLFQTSLPSQTLAASLRAQWAFDEQDLPPQLTLGEDNGLRGYPARQFASDRLVVLNLEDRIDTGLELWSLHLGAALFADVGWIPDAEQGLSFGAPLRSVGLGLRLGSSELFGGGIFRLDLAFPLDEVEGEGFEVSLSGGAGQVFRFFGNAAALTAEFGG